MEAEKRIFVRNSESRTERQKRGLRVFWYLYKLLSFLYLYNLLRLLYIFVNNYNLSIEVLISLEKVINLTVNIGLIRTKD